MVGSLSEDGSLRRLDADTSGFRRILNPGLAASFVGLFAPSSNKPKRLYLWGFSMSDKQIGRNGLDAELDVRALTPSFSDYLHRWQSRSHAVRADDSAIIDLAYGPTPSERLDLFISGPGSPVLVFFHGGYWRALDKSDFSCVAPAFLQAGISVAVVNFALIPDVPMAEIVRQCRASVAWLAHRGTSLGLDPDRFIACGHSAGGHLACMVAADTYSGFGLTCNPVKVVCSIGGLYDLEPIRRSYLNEILKLEDIDVASLSPVNVGLPVQMPVILGVGGQESYEYKRQQRTFETVCKAALSNLIVLDFPEDDHFTTFDQIADGQVTTAIIELARTNTS